MAACISAALDDQVDLARVPKGGTRRHASQNEAAIEQPAQGQAGGESQYLHRYQANGAGHQAASLSTELLAWENAGLRLPAVHDNHHESRHWVSLWFRSNSGASNIWRISASHSPAGQCSANTLMKR
jgi:hypothetical protein